MMLLIAAAVSGSQYLPAPKTEQTKIIAVVKVELKDPASARFRGLKRTANGRFCGWVNARNSFGGYPGFSVFFGGPQGISFLPPELSDPRLC